MIENLDILESLIVGRVRPHIYAFCTNTVPNYLKVGDTYRPVSQRLKEWRTHFPDLEQRFLGSASVSDDIYFRDHAVHSFLLEDRGRPRLERMELPETEYYSREFFGGADVADLEAAIDSIRQDHVENLGRYAFYDAAAQLPTTHHYERGPDWCLRPNQQAAVDAFATAVDAGRTNLLMYAVMRFGKTFTSLMCAKRVGAKAVLVVSAKADVKGEWKQTVESAGNFEGFRFLDADALLLEPDAITQSKSTGECVVVFLTLQDLQGTQLKEKHTEVFSTDIDVLIVDETHFGARAESYGQVLRSAKQPVETMRSLRIEADEVTVAEADAQLKVLQAKTTLHLSGSPYRILMGSEFAREDIIAFVQFADIIRAKEEWDRENPDENEWDNPYFGFPQMIRFAFNPNESAQAKLAALKERGVSYALAALLEPRSITRDAAEGLHKQFKHEEEILDLLRVIDGSQQDENLLGFLDDARIKQGQMCRHVVMVLPYRASCDAMQALIEKNEASFKNLGDYEIINISGVQDTTRFATPERVKAAIAKADAEGRKTLTLTVNRMLTGSTVEQWDTMLFLKDTASPQEYDQATFRLQSQHIRTLRSGVNDEPIKENLKPQTLLVDFDPLRLFQMQEQRSLMSNIASSEHAGNGDLTGRLREDLRISPVITINSNRLTEVEPANILAAVSAYNLNRSIADEARDVPIDLGVLDIDAIRAVIEKQAEIGSRAGLTISGSDGEDTDLDVDDEADTEDGDPDTGDTGVNPTPPDSGIDDAVDLQSLAAKLQTYYQRILFFAMLTPNPVSSLKDVIDAIGDTENERIAENLGLQLEVLKALFAAFDPFKLNALDYKILNISRLARDESLSPTERAVRALQKFTRISESEVRTPLWLCREMVARIPAQSLGALISRGEKILDIASKSGEFALALYERLVGELGVDPAVAKDSIYSLPTSTIAYEFTRRFYEVLGLNVANIAAQLTSYNLLSDQESGQTVNLEDAFEEGGATVKFGAVVGNPPYQESDGGAQQSARSIYPQFVAAAKSLDPEFLSFVIPSRWYAGGKSLGDFRAGMLADPHLSELHDFPRPEEVFPETNNRGGICYFLRDTNYDAVAAGGTRILTRDAQGVEFDAVRPLDTFGMGAFLRDSKSIELVERVISTDGFISFENQVSARKPFGLEGNIVRSADFHQETDGLTDPVLCYGKGKSVGFIERDRVRLKTDWIDRWKVLAPYANNIGTELNDDNQNAFVVAPGSVCSETFIVMGGGLDLDEESARNLVAYLKTRFARFLHSKAKVSQHGTKGTYRFVPLLDLTAASSIDWQASTDAIDDQLFDLYRLTAEEREHIRSSIKAMV
ncbi:Eco57I restriction-modification methylase domain-containing protein [Microcella sp.]|uniref:Eco57I restriction-modification methylase domain-containing protein n=1 Tax=Microcella sp. TaxID=1913979 RepID=UPI003919E862